MLYITINTAMWYPIEAGCVFDMPKRYRNMVSSEIGVCNVIFFQFLVLDMPKCQPSRIHIQLGFSLNIWKEAHNLKTTDPNCAIFLLYVKRSMTHWTDCEKL